MGVALQHRVEKRAARTQKDLMRAHLELEIAVNILCYQNTWKVNRNVLNTFNEFYSFL